MKKGILVKQRDITDCGAACLASIAAFYRLHLPVARIRQFAGTDKQGTTIAGLIEAASRMDLQARGVKGEAEHLSHISLPSIAHLVLENGLRHYVVLYKAAGKTVSYMDPAAGRVYKENKQNFLRKWTGILVLLVPGKNFQSGRHKISSFQRFWQLIQPHKGMLLQALGYTLMYTLLGLSISFYVQKIVDFVIPDGNLKLLQLMSAGMIAVLFFQMITGYLKSILALQTGQHIDGRLILGYYRHLMQLPQRFFDSMRVGEIISRVNDAVKIRVFINDAALNLVVNALITGFSLGLMFFYYWKLALLMLGILPFYFILYYISNRINKKWQRRVMEDAAAVETQMLESITAARTIKQFGLEEYAGYKTEIKFIPLLRSIYRTGVSGIAVNGGSEFINRLFTIFILWAGAYFVVRHELSPGELLSFYALTGYFTGPALSLVCSNKQMQDALIAADRLFEIIDLEMETTAEYAVECPSGSPGNIEFRSVDFSYGGRGTVFDNLNLAIHQNETTAIVGESGSGKSTLISLLQHLYPVNKGRIFIGDLDIKNIRYRSLRTVVGVVTQRTDLFAGNIAENIALGAAQPDMHIISDLCRRLGIDDFIQHLPSGYYTQLNEQGMNISEGQRQRLAIARALYRDPAILILDEATSSLDALSEQKVQETLDWFRKNNKTIIVIAHRLSTIRNCSRIIVLKDGRVAEEGSHMELLSKNNHYAKLWNRYADMLQ